MCGVIGCTSCSPQQRHFCKICGNTNSTHRSVNCPRRKRCRVPGCNQCAPGKTHFCKMCRDTNSSHRSSACPMGVTLPPRPPRPPRPQQLVVFGAGPGQKIKYASIAVVFEHKGELCTLIASRGVPGISRDKVTTAGGSVDGKETPRQASLRELNEEFGVGLTPQQIQRIGVCYHGDTAHFIVVLEGPPQISKPSHVSEILGSPRNVHAFFGKGVRFPMWKEHGGVTRIWGVPLSAFHTQYGAMTKGNALFARGGIFGFLFQDWNRSRQLLGI